jgi:hypothetical protein
MVTLPDGLPRTEVRRKIAPRDACPVSVDRTFDEQTMITHRPAHRPLHRRQNRLDLVPHRIAEHRRPRHAPSIKPETRSTLETRPSSDTDASAFLSSHSHL